MIIDSQVHLYHADTPEHPWPRDWRPNPHIGSFTVNDLVPLMDESGVDRAVIVPPIWLAAEDGLHLANDAAERFPGRFAIAAPFDPCAADAKTSIETWLDQPHVLGMRVGWLRWDEPGPDVPRLLIHNLEGGHDADFAWFWDACEQLEVPVMCTTGTRVRLLEPVIASHPRLPVIIDHLASAHPRLNEGAFAGLDDLVDLARYPNVYVKACKAPDRSTEAFPFADVHPVLMRLVDAYGAERLMWASDASELLAEDRTYSEALRLWQEALPLTEDQKDWILGRTAATVLRWPKG